MSEYFSGVNGLDLTFDFLQTTLFNERVVQYFGAELRTTNQEVVQLKVIMNCDPVSITNNTAENIIAYAYLQGYGIKTSEPFEELFIIDYGLCGYTT